MKRPPVYGVNAALASGVLYFVLDLSRGDRGPVDWIVIGLVVSAVLYNLVRLGARLYTSGGGRALWHEVRAAVFWAVGLSTLAATSGNAAASAAGWELAVGWLMIALALFDTVWLCIRERAIVRRAETA